MLRLIFLQILGGPFIEDILFVRLNQVEKRFEPLLNVGTERKWREISGFGA